VSSKAKSPRSTRILAAFILLWVVSISGILGNSGIAQAYRLRRAVDRLEGRVTDLDLERSRLKVILRDLEKSRTVQEIVVRDTLGYVREGEIVFEFAD